jgi:hypothetical protein
MQTGRSRALLHHDVISVCHEQVVKIVHDQCDSCSVSVARALVCRVHGGSSLERPSIAHPKVALTEPMEWDAGNERRAPADPAWRPLRLRVENELGFKMVKYLRPIKIVDDYRKIGEGMGGVREDVQQYDMSAHI